jgi:hypothetical protein
MKDPDDILQDLAIPEFFLEHLADDAAALVELDTEEVETYSPGDRMPITRMVDVLAQDEVTIDATEHIMSGLIDYENGSHVHATELGMARVNVSAPQVFVVDAMGNRIEGGRVMVTYYNLELDTP